jgi:predicted RNA-binding Zn-ribbon protein involved in translation (DUF1610 family)
MPVMVSCTGCGKQLNVKDEYLGKRLKCPQCGATFTATASTRPGKIAKQRDARLHISPGMIALIVAVIAIPSIIAFWKYGPAAVEDEWEKNLKDSELNVESVVERGLLDYDRIHDPFIADPKFANMRVGGPRALNVTFFFGPMHITMPEEVGFAGVSSEGAFKGFYHPRSGEVEVDAEIGGMSLSTGILVRHGNKWTHLTGREKDSHLTVEVDGQPGA